ncbi:MULTISPECIES: YiiD C-terminal domain-containing protein [unclassified Pseudomonas]|uniref:YiiD C-terminal domain-containing protein n=1 Tax=unclassified Pseudomonas TaxID=196821 RepID=UPI00119BE21B|nr:MULTISPECIES: YiiD C-terminal domain-containing protein [unclassified Pseudomonas]TWC11639.1 thioesterase domain-containing protein [Pseudomonas sp. SJZ075]TWC21417.1 thioesterase domain-containing protein [Pseudomonas sp. SJZ074]TWC28220.1 thioesterase domain-containing protein [Pseudomonas sp. SJZ078]TWC39084.1 thioesterase domain-containing protein [Pseudomonas sp. SJZ085]TWC48249.1 thioesterase domain-containing protein [Pseudomonas sp. SJZ124]
MNRNSRYLESILHHDIPLTRDMGLKVLDWQARQLRLFLPLAANVNHKSTMFGGSLYCGAVLGGWGWLHLALREEGIEDGHIVIQEGQISYPLPVTRDAAVLCDAPEEKVWKRFLATYQRYGRARLTLQTRVVNDGSEEVAVRFEGQYVLHR